MRSPIQKQQTMNTKNIDRREFLKKAGTGVATLGAVALAGACAPKKTGKALTQGSGEDSRAHVLETGKMELRVNPATGDRVSLLGYGCMRWQMKKDANGRDTVDQDNVNELVDYAIAHGVNYFDSAPTYLQGQSEGALGKALSRHPRDSYFIATKLSNFNNQSRAGSMKMYQDSFRHLQTDHLDYYLLHSLGRGGAETFAQRFVDNGMIDFLLKEREAGKIRQLGLSFHGSQDQFDYLLTLHDKYHWNFLQIQMNYWDWKHADGNRNVNANYLYDELDKREIPIVVMEPLMGGRLANPTESVARRLKERDPHASLASWAFRFVGSYPRVLTALSGMVYLEHLQDNLKTFMDFQPLSEEELDFLGTDIADIMARFPTINCTNCDYCMPCPYGIDIPRIFKHYNDCVNNGTFVQNRDQEDYEKLRRAYLVSYDRAVPTIRQASHCTTCEQCVPYCPQSIDIPRELLRIDRYVERLKRGTLEGASSGE